MCNILKSTVISLLKYTNYILLSQLDIEYILKQKLTYK